MAPVTANTRPPRLGRARPGSAERGGVGIPAAPPSSPTANPDLAALLNHPRSSFEFGTPSWDDTKPMVTVAIGGCHDHGSTALGGWQNRSENPGPGGQYPRLVIEWTADLHRRGPVTIHAGLGVHEENSSGPGRFGETVTCPSILSLRGKVFYFL